MANTKSAAKRARQTKKRTLRNRSILTGIKHAQKAFRQKLTGTDKADAAELKTAHSAYVSELDRAVKRGVLHRNAANRYKSVATRAVASK